MDLEGVRFRRASMPISRCDAKLRRVIVLRSLASFLIVFALSTHAEGRKVRMSIPGYSTLMAYTVAQEKGYYRDEGLDVELILMGGGIGIQALVAGDVDFGGSAGPGLIAALRGIPVRLVFTSFYRPMHWLVAKPDIREVKDLKGKKVAVSTVGSLADFFLREVLSKHGLKGGDVAVVGVGANPNRYAALTSGSVDAAQLATPYNFMAEEAGFRELESFTKADLVELQGSLLTTEKLLQSEPVTVEKFIRGTVKGFRYARENRLGTIPNFARNLKVKEPVAARTYDLIVPAMTADGTVGPEEQRKALEPLLKPTQVKEMPPLDKIFNYSLTNKVNAELKAAGWRPGP